MKIVMLSGKQGSGKTSLSNALAAEWELSGGVVLQMKFAGVLYEMHDAVLSILNDYLPDRGLVKDGPLLQMLGTEWGRKTIGENVWV